MGTPVEKQTGAECCNRSRARRVPPISKFRWPPDLVCSRSIYPAEQAPDDAASHSKTAARAMQNCASTSSTCRRLCHFVIEGMGEGGVYASTHVIVYDMCRRPPDALAAAAVVTPGGVRGRRGFPFDAQGLLVAEIDRAGREGKLLPAWGAAVLADGEPCIGD